MLLTIKMHSPSPASTFRDSRIGNPDLEGGMDLLCRILEMVKLGSTGRHYRKMCFILNHKRVLEQPAVCTCSSHCLVKKHISFLEKFPTVWESMQQKYTGEGHSGQWLRPFHEPGEKGCLATCAS